MTIPFVRTPESCFVKIPDFPFSPRYLENAVEGLRMAYYDIPAKDASSNEVFLCLHGDPTWSYLYRHMIPVLVTTGRVVCVDLIGFGRSDKPTLPEDYSFSMHRTALLSLVKHLALENITLVVQDWGGILGLTLPLERPSRYNRLLVMNTMLPIEPESSELARDLISKDPQSGFAAWHKYSQASDDWNVGELVNLTCRKQLPQEIVAAYNAPFPSPAYKVAANIFPTLVPISSKQDGYAIGREALNFWKYQWNGSTFAAVGGRDRVIPPKLMHSLISNIRGCPAPLILPDTGHFVQEQSGKQVATAALEYFARAARKLSKL